MEIEKDIKIRAENILNGKFSLETLKDESEIIKTLNDIIDDKIKENPMKILDNIENYLNIKEKNRILKEDNDFLKNLAKSLREQTVRKSDITSPTLFQIKNPIGEDLFFITRSALEEYRKYNKQCGNLIEVPSANSMELLKLLEIIKRNF